jgi:hypothetical protein
VVTEHPSGRCSPFPAVALTPAEHAALQRALLSVQALPRSLSLVPVPGALEVWAKRRIPGGARWVRVQSIPSPTGPGLSPWPDEVQTDFMPL